jgi:hypothetical protein
LINLSYVYAFHLFNNLTNLNMANKLMRLGDRPHARAILLLCAMTPDLVADLIGCINDLGSNGAVALSASNPDGVPKFLAPLSKEYIPDEAFEDFALGYSALIFSDLMSPSLGLNKYAEVYRNVGNAPPDMAMALAQMTETKDDLSQLKDRGFVEKIKDSLRSAGTSAFNNVSAFFGSNARLDGSQKADFDNLYEMVLLGRNIRDLQLRSKLMTSNAILTSAHGLMRTGDVYDDDGGFGDVDQELADVYVGDLFTESATIPSGMLGGLGALNSLGTASKRNEQMQVLSDAGYTVAPGDRTVKATAVKKPFLRRAVDGLLNAKPSTALLAGASVGLTPILVKLAKQLFRKKGQGDPIYGDPNYGEITVTGNWDDLLDSVARQDGDVAADHLANGDIDEYLKCVLREAGDISDEELVATMDGLGDVFDEEVGDVSDLTPEMGNIFSKIKLKRAKKKAGRQIRKGVKRQARAQRKMSNRDAIERTRAMGERALDYEVPGSQFDPYEQDYGPTGYYDDYADFEPTTQSGFDQFSY